MKRVSCLTILVLTLAAGCGEAGGDDHDHGSNNGHHHHENNGGTNNDMDMSTERASTEGHFFLAYETEPETIEQSDTFTMTVSVYESDTMEAMVSDATLTADAEMPAHGHGMTTTADVTDNGDGTFTVDGMNFHMSGHWRIFGTVESGEMSDEYEFNYMME